MSRKLLGLAIFTMALVAFLSAGPACAGEVPAVQAAVAAVATPANCGSGIALPMPAAKGETCSASQPESVLPGVVETSHRLGYCHCGCSSVRTCRTSADCGGASCDQTISCC